MFIVFDDLSEAIISVYGAYIVIILIAVAANRYRGLLKSVSAGILDDIPDRHILAVNTEAVCLFDECGDLLLLLAIGDADICHGRSVGFVGDLRLAVLFDALRQQVFLKCFQGILFGAGLIEYFIEHALRCTDGTVRQINHGRLCLDDLDVERTGNIGMILRLKIAVCRPDCTLRDPVSTQLSDLVALCAGHIDRSHALRGGCLDLKLKRVFGVEADRGLLALGKDGGNIHLLLSAVEAEQDALYHWLARCVGHRHLFAGVILYGRTDHDIRPLLHLRDGDGRGIAAGLGIGGRGTDFLAVGKDGDVLSRNGNTAHSKGGAVDVLRNAQADLRCFQIDRSDGLGIVLTVKPEAKCCCQTEGAVFLQLHSELDLAGCFRSLQDIAGASDLDIFCTDQTVVQQNSALGDVELDGVGIALCQICIELVLQCHVRNAVCGKLALICREIDITPVDDIKPHVIQRIAAAEGGAVELDMLLREIDDGQVLAIFKCIFRNDGDAVREGDLTEIGAAAEHPCAQTVYAVRDGELRQLRAS